jgi:hypothetical protein
VTLLVEAARSSRFVLQAADQSVSVRDPETDEVTPYPGPPVPIGPKVWKLSDWALADFGGCLDCGEQFRSILASRISSDDDIGACIEAASDAWALTNGCPFLVHVSGFRRDGTIDYLRITTGHPPLRADDDAIAFFVSPPSMGNLSELEQFTLNNWLEDPYETFDLQFALKHVSRAHRYFRDTYPDFITEDLDVLALCWNAEQMKPAQLF